MKNYSSTKWKCTKNDQKSHTKSIFSATTFLKRPFSFTYHNKSHVWGQMNRKQYEPRSSCLGRGGRHALCKCAYTLGMFAVQSGSVLICLVGLPDGVLGRDLCHLITCGVESGGAASTLHIHSQSTAAKNYPIKALRPSTHHRWRSSNARRGRTPASVPRTASHPFFGSKKLQRNMGTDVRPVQNSLFVPNFSKSGRHPRP